MAHAEYTVAEGNGVFWIEVDNTALFFANDPERRPMTFTSRDGAQMRISCLIAAAQDETSAMGPHKPLLDSDFE